MSEKKLISAIIPTYNEADNIAEGINRVKKILESISDQYDYEILVIDNYSTDGTRDIIRILANKDRHIKVILNAINVGWSRSSYYGMINASGDAVVLLAADMQEPPELIPEFVKLWNEGKGATAVIGIKSKSKENPFQYMVRSIYYKLLKKIAYIQHIEQFMGFGLYDKSFIDVLRGLDDPLPYLRGMVAELCGNRIEVEYTQDVRKKGKTHFNFWGKYDLAMLGITSYSKMLLRIATVIGGCVGGLSVILGLTTIILKLFKIIDYPIGTAAISSGVFLFGAANLFFLGLLGEYIVNINIRVMNRPLVIEEERINFD